MSVDLRDRRHQARRAGLVRAALVGAVTMSVVAAGAGAATAADDTTAPVLSDVKRSPVHPVPAYNGIAGNTTWTPSTSTGLRDWFTDDTVTLDLSATDDVAVTTFVVKVGAADPVDVPAVVSAGAYTASFEVKAEQSSAVQYSAVDAAGNTSAVKSTTVKIDRTPPSASWPGVPNGTIAHATTYAGIKPALTDVAGSFNGSGGSAIRLMWIDGKPVDLVPLDVATLSVGKHTWAIVVGDAAGNQAKHTLTFEVTTSYADVTTLVDRYVTEGAISAANGADLKGLISTASSADSLGSKPSAIAALEDFSARAKKYAPRGVARTVLTADAAHLTDVLRGKQASAVQTGTTTESYEPAQRMPQVYAGPSVTNTDPDFKVLLFANRPGGFRHQHIPATMKFIQQQGKDNNFDVDVWDYMAPNESVPGNPFESLERLKQYDAIVAVSSVGNAQFVTNRPTTADPAVAVDEQAILKQYVNQGGGFVAIHGATDSMHDWNWYKDLVGGEFDNHSSSVNGQQHNCEACRTTEVVTEDRTNPSTEHFPRSIHVLDELYNWKTFLPRERVHVLQTLTEASYVGGVNAADGRTEGADHPISWCRNWDGGRSYTQALMHNYELSEDPRFQQQILEGIRWTAGQSEANCITHNEVQSLLTAQQESGGVSARTAAAIAAEVKASYDAYLTTDRTTALDRARNAVRLLDNDSAGSTQALSVLRPKAAELVQWMTMLDETSTRLRFLAEPKAVTAPVGTDAVFSVEAAGTDVTYQWQQKTAGGEWTDVADETTVALRVVPTSAAQDGTLYRVQIADAGSELLSQPARLTVTDAAPATITLTAPTGTRYGTSGELVATVTGAGGASASGSVSLFEGSQLLGTVQAAGGTARFTLPARLAVGSHALRVAYAGSESAGAAESSTTVVVAKATASVRVKAAKKSVRKGTKVRVDVTVSAPGFTPAGKVRLYDGTKVVGTKTLTKGTRTFSFSSKKAGKHRLTVRYLGASTSAPATSKTVVITVRT